MVSITPEGFFLVIALVVALGFVLDYFFSRTRITSILPLMLFGLALVQTGIIRPPVVAELVSISGFVSSFAVAMILLGVGLQIDLLRLYTVFGRALVWTLVCQAVTGVAISILVLFTFGWEPIWAFVFGFAVSGPSSIVVQALVRQLVMKEELKTTVLFEAVLTDVLQLVVPTLLIQIYLQGSVSGAQITETVLLAVVGSIALGVAAGLLWVWTLDKGRRIATGYTWALTVTLALGLYAVTIYTNLTGSLVIFIFGAIVGNAILLDRRRGTNVRSAVGWLRKSLAGVRRLLQLNAEGVDVHHISEIQREANYIVGAFFLFYIGTIFIWPTPEVEYVFLVPLIAIGIVLIIRYSLVGILRPFLDPNARVRRGQLGLIVMNVPRGLSAAVVAGLVVSLGVSVPGFTDGIFMMILYTNIAATVGVFIFYRPTPPTPAAPAPLPAVSPGPIPEATNANSAPPILSARPGTG